MSTEHVLPHHWKRHFPYSQLDTTSRLAYNDSFRKDVAGGFSLFDLAVKGICQDCNNGWLSQLDLRAKPLIFDLAKGRRTVIHTSEIALLTTWTVKTAMVRTLADARENQQADASQFQEFHKERSLGSNAQVQAALTNAEGVQTSNTPVTVMLALPKSGQHFTGPTVVNVVTIAFGSLFVQCLISHPRFRTMPTGQDLMTASRKEGAGAVIEIAEPGPLQFPSTRLTRRQIALMSEPLHLAGFTPYFGDGQKNARPPE